MRKGPGAVTKLSALILSTGIIRDIVVLNINISIRPLTKIING